MGIMKQTINAQRISNKEIAAEANHKRFLAEQAYANSAMRGYSKEIVGLQAQIDYLIDRLGQAVNEIDQLHRTNARLNGEVMNLKLRMARQGYKEEDTYEEEAPAQEEQDSALDQMYELQKQYRPKTNIKWDCGVPPVDIVFNEIDLFRYENNITSMIEPLDIKKINTTLYVNCKKYTNWTLGKLLTEYAKARGLNY